MNKNHFYSNHLSAAKNLNDPGSCSVRWTDPLVVKSMKLRTNPSARYKITDIQNTHVTDIAFKIIIIILSARSRRDLYVFDISYV